MSTNQKAPSITRWRNTSAIDNVVIFIENHLKITQKQLKLMPSHDMSRLNMLSNDIRCYRVVLGVILCYLVISRDIRAIITTAGTEVWV